MRIYVGRQPLNLPEFGLPEQEMPQGIIHFHTMPFEVVLQSAIELSSFFVEIGQYDTCSRLSGNFFHYLIKRLVEGEDILWK